MLTANAEDCKENAIWIAPVLREMPGVRASAYFFGDVLLGADGLLKLKLLKENKQVALHEGNKMKSCIFALKKTLLQ